MLHETLTLNKIVPLDENTSRQTEVKLSNKILKNSIQKLKFCLFDIWAANVHTSLDKASSDTEFPHSLESKQPNHEFVLSICFLLS